MLALGGDVFTEEQKKAINRLRNCSMSSGSWDKRFFRGICETEQLAELAAKHGGTMPKPLTPKQHEQLMRMLHTYRRQGTGCRCDECRAGNTARRKKK